MTWTRRNAGQAVNVYWGSRRCHLCQRLRSSGHRKRQVTLPDNVWFLVVTGLD
jgi:hypothetical protein